jgi:hypothetical protein
MSNILWISSSSKPYCHTEPDFIGYFAYFGDFLCNQRLPPCDRQGALLVFPQLLILGQCERKGVADAPKVLSRLARASEHCERRPV